MLTMVMREQAAVSAQKRSDSPFSHELGVGAQADVQPQGSCPQLLRSFPSHTQDLDAQVFKLHARQAGQQQICTCHHKQQVAWSS